jgi:hypothetical protein
VGKIGRMFTRRSLKRWLAPIAVVAALAIPGVASADARDFQFVNSSGTTINELYVAPSASSDWADDILGTGVLESGFLANITFARYNPGVCKYDIKVVDGAGASLEAYEFDLCSTSKVEFAADHVFYYS